MRNKQRKAAKKEQQKKAAKEEEEKKKEANKPKTENEADVPRLETLEPEKLARVSHLNVELLIDHSTVY